MANFLFLRVCFKIYAILLSNKSKPSETWIVKVSLLDKLSYRLPEAARTDRLIGLRIFHTVLMKILRNRITYKKLLPEGGFAIYDVYDKFQELLVNYVNKQSTEKASWYIYKVGLCGNVNKVSLLLQVPIFVLFSVPFVILSVFSSRRSNYALLMMEAVEISSLLYILKKNKIKKVLDFVPYEKDGNLLSLLLMQQKIYVAKVPSPGPLYLHNSLLLGDHLILSSQYQFEEYENFKDKGIKIKTVEKWLPEFAFEYIDLYVDADRQDGKNANKIGYYSHGAWIRQKEGHRKSILRVYEDEIKILSFLNVYLRARPELSLKVYMHPREMRAEIIEDARAFYRQHLPDIDFVFSGNGEKTSHCFSESALAICAYSSVIYERLFCGFKTLIGLPHTEAFPMKESRLNNIVFKTYEEMAGKVNAALKYSAKEFFSAFELSGYIYSDYPYFLNYESRITEPQTLYCKQCLLDSRVSTKFFVDEKGICNYCNFYTSSIKALGSESARKRWLDKKIVEIKSAGKNKAYDCILGISGGVDSSYLAYWAKENGLRPLVVHLDNGWNSELAVENIRNICSILNFELKTLVINWEEFRELQVAYLKAGVIDLEVLTDHAILAANYGAAAEHGIRYILNGFNLSTEAIMPVGWGFDKYDWKNIKDISAKYGTKRIRTFPHFSFLKKLYYYWFLKLEVIQVLNYLPYTKKEAKKLIAEKLLWRDYGGKHYESIFTKFYQAYILPTRFKIDKRKAHLSTLICSGQISKDEAYKELEKPLYTDAQLREEKEYVLKKLRLTEEEFDCMMKEPVRSHSDFKTEKPLWNAYFKVVKVLKFDFES
jgi:N-acetyl sugar amidotransferase